MIALTPFQQELYEAAKALADNGVAPRPCNLAQVLGWQPSEVTPRLKACVRKWHLLDRPDGSIAVFEPPHDQVMREVCAALTVVPEEVQSDNKSMKLTRARRTIAGRLHRLGYSFKNIADVTNRHPSTVLDYLFPERAATRSQQRVAARRHSRGSA